LIDCATIATVAALLHFRRPDVTVIGQEVTIHTLEERHPVPLTLHHIPICVSFAFFSQGNRLLVDPNRLEERLCDGDMTITVNTHRELCALFKAGGSPLPPHQLLHCMELASKQGADIIQQIRDTVQSAQPTTNYGGGI
jgi:exosome complex component RRP45